MQVIFYNRDFTATAQPPAKVTVERYSKNMTGGCKDAFLNIKNVADKWEMMKLLRAPIEIFGDDGELVWWGFVNRVTVPLGESQRLGLGLNELYNYIIVTYDEGDTAAGSNAVSISEYGQKEKKITDTGLNSTNATAKRDLYLQEHKYASPEIEFSGGSQEISLECYGWNSTLGWKHYSNVITTSVANETQLAAIITDAGQFLQGSVITDASGLTSTQHRDGNNTAGYYISQLLSAGTNNTQPYLSYVDEERYLHIYERTAQPAQPEYLLREDGKLVSRLGKVIPDQECKVSVWVKPKDAPATLEGFSSMYSFFIESAEYNVAQDKTTYRAAGAYEQIRLADYVSSVISGDGGGNYTNLIEYPTIYNVVNPVRLNTYFELRATNVVINPLSERLEWASATFSRGQNSALVWPYSGDDSYILLAKKGHYWFSFFVWVTGITNDVLKMNINGADPKYSNYFMMFPVRTADNTASGSQSWIKYEDAARNVYMRFLEGTAGMTVVEARLQIAYLGS